MPSPPVWNKKRTEKALDRFDELSRECYSRLSREWVVNLHENLKELQKVTKQLFEQSTMPGGAAASLRDRLRVTAVKQVSHIELEALTASISSTLTMLQRSRFALDLIKEAEEGDPEETPLHRRSSG